MLVRFLRRGFHNDSIVEPGEVISVPDNTSLGQHMVRVEGDSDHVRDAQPFAGVFRADLAYSPDPLEMRLQMTEAARQRAEATRVREAAEEARRVTASVGQQPAIMAPVRPPVAAPAAPAVHTMLPVVPKAAAPVQPPAAARLGGVAVAPGAANPPDQGGDAADG